MDWDDLRFFLAVARLGNLSQAAKSLRTSPSTVSRRIDALEDSLGVPLFTRHARGYALTAEGRAVLEPLDQVEGTLRDLPRRLEDREDLPRGTVRLATSITIANHLVIPALPALRARYPNLGVEIITGIANLNLTRREADMALRLSRPTLGRLVARRVALLPHALYGSTQFLNRHCPNRTWEEARRAPVVLWDEALRDMPMAQWLDRLLPNPTVALVTNDLTSQLAAVRASLGLAVLPHYCARSFPDLEPLKAPEPDVIREMYLVVHDDARRTARVRALVDFLANSLF